MNHCDCSSPEKPDVTVGDFMTLPPYQGPTRQMASLQNSRCTAFLAEKKFYLRIQPCPNQIKAASEQSTSGASRTSFSVCQKAARFLFSWFSTNPSRSPGFLHQTNERWPATSRPCSEPPTPRSPTLRGGGGMSLPPHPSSSSCLLGTLKGRLDGKHAQLVQRKIQFFFFFVQAEKYRNLCSHYPPF